MLHVPQGSTSIQSLSSRDSLVSKLGLYIDFLLPKCCSLYHHSRTPRLFGAFDFLHFLPASMLLATAGKQGHPCNKKTEEGKVVVYLSCLEKSSLSSSSSQLSSQRCVLAPFAFEPWPCSVSSCGQSSHSNSLALYPAIKGDFKAPCS